MRRTCATWLRQNTVCVRFRFFGSGSPVWPVVPGHNFPGTRKISPAGPPKSFQLFGFCVCARPLVVSRIMAYVVEDWTRRVRFEREKFASRHNWTKRSFFRNWVARIRRRVLHAQWFSLSSAVLWRFNAKGFCVHFSEWKIYREMFLFRKSNLICISIIDIRNNIKKERIRW